MNEVNAVRYPKCNRPRKVRAYNCLVRNYSLLSQLPFPIRIFDVGCGVGDTTKLLTLFNNVVRVVAIDKAPDAIAVADCFNDDLRIQYELADAENILTWPKSIDGTFDLVTAFGTINKIMDHQAMIRNIGKVLKRGGYLSCTLPATVSQHELDFEEFMRQSKRWWNCRVKNPTGHQLVNVNGGKREDWFEELLTANGFQIEHSRVVQEDIVVGKEEALEYFKMRYLRNVNVDEKEYEELADHAFRAYSKSCQHLDDKYMVLRFDTMDIVARKT